MRVRRHAPDRSISGIPNKHTDTNYNIDGWTTDQTEALKANRI